MLLVITFPVIRPGFGLQIDPQIHWVFNYLFDQDFSEVDGDSYPITDPSIIEYLANLEDMLHHLTRQVEVLSTQMQSFVHYHHQSSKSVVEMKTSQETPTTAMMSPVSVLQGGRLQEDRDDWVDVLYSKPRVNP